MHRLAVTPAHLIDRLIDSGLTRMVAEDLASKFSPASIERQLRALPFRHARNPAQCLQSSIRGEWAMPAEMVRAKIDTRTGSPGKNEQWSSVDALAADIEVALGSRPDRLLLELHAVDQARIYFPNQIGNDGRDMENMPRAVRMVLAFELGIYDTLQTPFRLVGREERRFGPGPSVTVGADGPTSDTPGPSRPLAARQEALL